MRRMKRNSLAMSTLVMEGLMREQQRCRGSSRVEKKSHQQPVGEREEGEEGESRYHSASSQAERQDWMVAREMNSSRLRCRICRVKENPPQISQGDWLVSPHCSSLLGNGQEHWYPRGNPSLAHCCLLQLTSYWSSVPARPQQKKHCRYHS